MKLFLALAIVLAASATIAAEETKLNVVFILVDDLGYMDIGANNPKTFYETPNVDKLAESGMRFTNAYAACCVCSPTRASIMTGKYPARLKTTEYFCGQRAGKLLPAKYLCRLPLEETTIAETLKDAGYATFFAGKWHLGPEGFWPENQGFDVNHGRPYLHKKYFSDGEHLPDRLATETVKFIEANKDQPFLAYLSFYSVHTPLIGRLDLVKKYKKKAETVSHSGSKWKPERRRQARQYQDHAVYAAMVEAMDLAVGKVLDSLDRLKIADRTMVVFFSDNGGLSTSEGSPTANVPLRAGKGWNYEGGIREPCIIRLPRVTKPGSTCDHPIISTDFFPTILAAAKLPSQPEKHVDGVSISKLLADPSDTLDREAIYWHYPHYGNQGGAPSGVIRMGDWKLIEWFEDDSVELFNLADDIGESVELAKKHPERAEKMRKMLSEWRKSVDANMPRHRQAKAAP